MKFKNSPKYRWVIVAACFLMVFTALGFCSSNKSIYLSAITEALDIRRSLFSINDSCRFVTTAIVNLLFGTLIMRFGPRKLIAAGFICLIISTLIYATATNIFLFYIGGCFLGLGLSWTTTTMVGYVVSIWCKEKKGTIMGLILASNGIGAVVATQIAEPIIYQEGNLFGYQDSYKLVALILAVVGALVVFFFKDKPAGVTETEKPKDKPRGGLSDLVAMLKTPRFCVALVGIFLTGAALQGVSGIAAAHMTDVGLDTGYVATVLSFHSLVLSCAKFLTGISYDHFGLRRTVLFCDIAAVIAFLCLASLSSTPLGMALAMVYGAFSSLALPLETVMLPLIAGDLFGPESYAQYLGVFVSVNVAGYAVGAPLVNLVFDLFGSYIPVLFVVAAMLVCITVAYQWVLKDSKTKAKA